MSHTVQGAPHWSQVRAADPQVDPSTAPASDAVAGRHPESAPPTLWQEGRVRGRDVVLGTIALTLGVVALDLLLTGRLSFFFDVCLVPICLVAAFAVRPREFFYVAVLPPLLVLSTTLELGFVAPEALSNPGDGPLQAALVGLADHGAATLWAQGVALAVLAIRRQVLALPAIVPPTRKLPPPVDVQGGLVAAYDDAVEAAGVDALAEVDAINAEVEMQTGTAQANLSGSPAPTRTISG